MPLDEVSPNIDRATVRAGPVGRDGNDSCQSDALLPSQLSAIQSMLKRTTEVADNGSFPPRSTRLPRWQSQNTISSRGSSMTTSVSNYKNHAPRPPPRDYTHSRSQRSLYRIPRHDSVQSTQINMSKHAHQLHYIPRSKQSGLPRGPTFNRSYRTLHSYRSQSTIGSLGNGDRLHSISPASDRFLNQPRPPASRLVSSSSDQAFQRYCRRSNSATTAASLPGTSTYRRNFRNAYYRPTHYAHCLHKSHGRPRQGRGLYTCAWRASPYLTSHSQSLRMSSTTSLDAQSAATSESSIPFYYDYSESFVESGQVTDSFSPSASGFVAAPGSGTRSRLRNACSPFGTMPGSEFAPIELPTKYNRRSSQETLTTNVEEQTRAAFPPQPTQKHVSVGNPNLQSCVLQPLAQLLPNELRSAASQSHTTESGLYEAAITPHTVEPVTEFRSISPRACASPSSGTFFANADRSPRNLVQLAARAHSPVDDARDAHLNLAAAFDELEHYAVARAQTVQPEVEVALDWKLPNFQFHPLSMSIDSTSVSQKSPVNGPHSSLEVLSPCTPRPPPSPSRECSSNILDADEIGSLIDCYHSQWPASGKAMAPGGMIERSTSPLKATQLHTPFTDKKASVNGKLEHGSFPSFWEKVPYPSPLTSHEKSTVGSLLDKHIQSLGLRSKSRASSVHSQSSKSDTRLDGGDSDAPKQSSNVVPDSEREIHPMMSNCYRPNSLTSSAQKRLVPKRLFASQDADGPLFPFMSDESEIPQSTSSLDETPQASYGWLRLSSTGNISGVRSLSKPSLLSGECGDLDTDESNKRFNFRKFPSFSFSSLSKIKSEDHAEPVQNRYHLERVAKPSDEVIRRQVSARRRKLQIHLGSASRANQTFTRIHGPDQDHRSVKEACRPKPPLYQDRHSTSSAVADADNTSKPASQRPLESALVNTGTQQPQSKNRSDVIVTTAFSTQSGKDQKGLNPERTLRRQLSKTSLAEPVNTSRIAPQTNFCAPQPKSSIPQLAKPELGPPLTAGQFDFNSAYGDESRTPLPAVRNIVSSFSDTEMQQNEGTTRFHRRLDSLRTRLSRNSCKNKLTGLSGFTSGEGMKMSYSCQFRGPSPAFQQQSLISTTVPMSDLAYKRRRVVEKLKEWWNRRFAQRRWYRQRTRVTYVGGLLV